MTSMLQTAVIHVDHFLKAVLGMGGGLGEGESGVFREERGEGGVVEFQS